jgi:hypothetical protein
MSEPLGNLPVVFFNLGHSGVPWGRPVAGQLRPGSDHGAIEPLNGDLTSV